MTPITPDYRYPTLDISVATDQFAGDFFLSVTRAMRDQLLSALDSLSRAPLNDRHLADVEARSGVYQIFIDGEPVYVGKANRSLRARLDKHLRKLGGRQGGLLGRAEFKCLYVLEDLSAMAPEKMLIDYFRKEGVSEWNYNGFGNNDPGRRRDASLVKRDHFDRAYPIKLDLELAVVPTKRSTLRSVARAIKRDLPYTFRFDKQLPALPVGESELTGMTVKTAKDWFSWIASQLPVGWSVVALPGYVICYKMRPDSIPSRMESWLKTEAGIVHRQHKPSFSNDPLTDEDLVEVEIGEIEDN